MSTMDSQKLYPGKKVVYNSEPGKDRQHNYIDESDGSDYWSLITVILSGLSVLTYFYNSHGLMIHMLFLINKFRKFMDMLW